MYCLVIHSQNVGYSLIYFSYIKYYGNAHSIGLRRLHRDVRRSVISRPTTKYVSNKTGVYYLFLMPTRALHSKVRQVQFIFTKLIVFSLCIYIRRFFNDR